MRVEVDRLFNSALELPSSERQGFVMQSCADLSVSLEVESLLQYTTSAEMALDAAVHHVAVSLREKGGLSPSDRIGPYRILSLLGYGGMGAVYLAERADGTFQQKVAAKVLQSANAEVFLAHFW